MAGRKGAPSTAARAKTGRANSHASNTKKVPKKPQTPTTGSSDAPVRPDEKQSVSSSERKQQQRVLDVFRHAFQDVLSSPTFTNTLQTVKQALYDRDFARAFGDPEHLAVYAARWSPTRALCYASVLDGIGEHLQPLWTSPSRGDSEPAGGPAGDHTDGTATSSTKYPFRRSHLKVLSVGGGAAELVAVAAFLNRRQKDQQDQLEQLEPPRQPRQPSALVSSASITLLDSGPWQPVIARLLRAVTAPPPLSKYASAAARLANSPLATDLTCTFVQHDVLALGRPRLAALLRGGGDDTNANTITTSTSTAAKSQPVLITILFTLNELFNGGPGGLGRTTAFLLELARAAPPGSLLLVVDSPGSYSETGVGSTASGGSSGGSGGGGGSRDRGRDRDSGRDGGLDGGRDRNGNEDGEAGGTRDREKRRYPMHWLLDRILLGERERPRGRRGDGDSPRRRWTKLAEQDSAWFRLAAEGSGSGGGGGGGLEYPIQLENMRYQMHLYRAEGTAREDDEEEEEEDDDEEDEEEEDDDDDDEKRGTRGYERDRE